MKKLFLILAFVFLPSLAFGQCNGVFPPGYFCGNPSGVPAPPIAAPGSSTATSLTIGTTSINGGVTGNILGETNSGCTAATPCLSNVANGSLCVAGPNAPINVICLGADPTGVADSTTAINTAFTTAAGSTAGSRAARSVYFPCGVYSVTGVTLPGSVSLVTGVLIYGDGPCSNIHMAAGHTSGNVLTIGSGVLNDTSDVMVRDIQISSAVQQVAGAYIFSKGAGRPQFNNIYMQDNHAYNGIQLDGVDFAKISHALIYTPANDGIVAYDGYDCGFTPATKTTNGTTAIGNAVLHLSNTSGLSVGMNVYDITLGPNTNMSGTIQSIVVNTSVTLTVASPSFAIGNGDTLLFGGTCAGTGMIIDGETTVVSAGESGIHISGGVGGWYVRSAHIYQSAGPAMAIDTNASSGLYNREIFLDPGTDIDSNIGSSLAVTANSISLLLCTGCWMGASTSIFGVNIQPQHAQLNPVETGAIIKFTGCRIFQNNGVAINWEDQGTLTVDGCDLSYNFGASGNGLTLNGTNNVGSVIVTNNMIRNNQSRPVSVAVVPQYMTFTSNNWTNNGFGPAGITPGATVICTNNLGGSGAC